MSSNFFSLVSFFIWSSLFEALDLFHTSSEYTSSTGNRALVYFAQPGISQLCILSRFSRLFVIPV